MDNDKLEELDVESIKYISTTQLIEFFQHIGSAIKIIEKTVPNTDRSAKVSREIQNSLACYKELYREKKKAALSVESRLFSNKSQKLSAIARPSRK